MPEIGTVETTRRPLLQYEQRQGPTTALGTVPPPERLHDEKRGAERGSRTAFHRYLIPH